MNGTITETDDNTAVALDTHYIKTVDHKPKLNEIKEDSNALKNNNTGQDFSSKLELDKSDKKDTQSQSNDELL